MVAQLMFDRMLVSDVRSFTEPVICMEYNFVYEESYFDIDTCRTRLNKLL